MAVLRGERAGGGAAAGLRSNGPGNAPIPVTASSGQRRRGSVAMGSGGPGVVLIRPMLERREGACPRGVINLPIGKQMI